MHDTIRAAAKPLVAHGEALATEGFKHFGLSGHTIGNTATGEQVMRARSRAQLAMVEAATVSGGTEGDTTRTVEIATSEGNTGRITLRIKERRDGTTPAERDRQRLLGLDYASLGRAETKQIEQLQADLSAITRYEVDADGNPVPVPRLAGKARQQAEHRLTNARRSLKLAQMDAAAASVLQSEHKAAVVAQLAADTAEAQRRANEAASEARIATLQKLAAQKTARSGLYD